MEIPLTPELNFLELVEGIPPLSSRKQISNYYWELWSFKLFHGPAFTESEGTLRSLEWSVVGRTDRITEAPLPKIPEDFSSIMIQFNNTALVTWTNSTRSGVLEKVDHSFGKKDIFQEKRYAV